MTNKPKCKNCGKPYHPEWWDRGWCLACDQDAAYDQLQSIRAIDAERARRGDRADWANGYWPDGTPRYHPISSRGDRETGE